MYKIIKRDGKIVDFDITKIANAIKKAFEATRHGVQPDDIIDFLALKVTADLPAEDQGRLILPSRIFRTASRPCCQQRRLCGRCKGIHSLPQAAREDAQHEIHHARL